MSLLETLFVTRESTILNTIQTIDKNRLQIALVVDENHRLLGTVTDGDIRRSILKGIDFEQPVVNIMNTSPIVAYDTTSEATILSLFQQHQIKQIPILNEQLQVVNIKSINDLVQSKKYENFVVLMAGGLGTRLRPLTNNCPKPMLKIGEKPILQTIIENFIEQGFYRFYISVNYKSEMIEQYFQDGSKWGVQIKYIRENERLGTAGALSLLQEHTTLPMIVMNGDLLTKVNFTHLLQFHNEHQSAATMCVREYDYQVPYGVIKTEDQHLIGIEEKPVQHFFVNAGIYVLNADVQAMIPTHMYYDMPTLFETLIEQKKNTVVYPIREYWLDIGRMQDFERADLEFAEVFTSD